MNHDEFVGQVQHLAKLPSRGDAEMVIRVTFETLGERIPAAAAEHVAAQLPPELGRHLKNRPLEHHRSLKDFHTRVAAREKTDIARASFHAGCVLETMCYAVSAGAVRKLGSQLPQEFQPLLWMPGTP
jgi:Uncharacterized conserved protein